MRVAALEPGDVDARAAGFRLGPRINAAGRLGSAPTPRSSCCSPTTRRARRRWRASSTGSTTTGARPSSGSSHAAEAACADQMSAAAIVVAGEGWHPGVVGIVASRLVERHRRPCVVIALDGEPGPRLGAQHRAATTCTPGLRPAAEHLLRFGGHRMAAGLEIEAERDPGLPGARSRGHAGERLAPADLVRVQQVDAVVPGGALNLDLAEELERLGPFGAGNPAPGAAGARPRASST